MAGDQQVMQDGKPQEQAPPKQARLAMVPHFRLKTNDQNNIKNEFSTIKLLKMQIFSQIGQS